MPYDNAYEVLYKLVENFSEHQRLEREIDERLDRQKVLDRRYDHLAARLGDALEDRPVAFNYNGGAYRVYRGAAGVSVEPLASPLDVQLPVETDLGPMPPGDEDSLVTIDAETS